MKTKIIEGLYLIPVVLMGAMIWPLFIPIVAIACIGKAVSAFKYEV